MDVLEVATGIVKKLKFEGYTAYFAGGWVRDYLMGHPSDDIDIATDAPPEVILDLFPRTILVGLAFGVVVVVEHGHQFEVATFRKDLDYLNGRSPAQIELSTPEGDASRRDFTINGMFYDPVEEVVHDFVHGADDIGRRVIRTIGNPDERFVEDRLRMIRAVRFAARFGFTIDPDTMDAIIANADTLFPAVAIERIWQEFTKMSRYPRFDHALVEMHRLGLLQVIFPALAHTHLHEIKEAVSSFKNFPEGANPVLFLLELFPQATAAEALDLCIYLHTSNAESDLAEFLVLMRQYIESEHELGIVDLHAWSHMYAKPSAKDCLQVIAAKMPLEKRKEFLAKHAARMKALQKHIVRIVEKKPLVSSAVLFSEGIKQGKIMGMLMKEAERIAVINDLDNEQQVLKILKTSHAWPK